MVSDNGWANTTRAVCSAPLVKPRTFNVGGPVRAGNQIRPGSGAEGIVAEAVADVNVHKAGDPENLWSEGGKQDLVAVGQAPFAAAAGRGVVILASRGRLVESL